MNAILERMKSRRRKEEQENVMYLIVGLGNPDRQYEGTRHNVGFEVIDQLADRLFVSVEEKKFLRPI